MKCSEGPVKIGVLNLWSNNIRKWVQYFLPIVLLFLCALLLTVVGLLCIVLLSCVYFCYLLCIILVYVCIGVLYSSVAGLLSRSQYLLGPTNGHIGTGFSWFPYVYKQILR